MRRALAITVDRNLPPRHRLLAEDATARVFGGCVAQGGRCTSTADCCQVSVQPGDYVLCYYYRSQRLNTAYCTRSSTVYGS